MLSVREKVLMEAEKDKWKEYHYRSANPFQYVTPKAIKKGRQKQGIVTK